MTITMLDTREHLQALLETVISQDANLLSMHLNEIEEEAATFLNHLSVFRSHASRGHAESSRRVLVDLTLSLEHMLHHVEDAVMILNRELDIGEEDSEDSANAELGG